MKNSTNAVWLLLFCVVVVCTLFFIPLIPQDLAYHNFADTRTLVAIPNFWNVLSNLPFMLFGVYGIREMQKIPFDQFDGPYRRAALLFFCGLLLTGFGSGYYHLAPANDTLMWDRLPMAIAFMSFFSFILAIHFGERLGSAVLWPFIVIGMGSVFYWDYTESIGAGDLRFYAVIQFLPMVLIPAIVLMFPTKTCNVKYIWWIIALYAAAKLGEQFDLQIYELFGISGHTLKHVIAAMSGIAFLQLLKNFKLVC